MASAQRKPGTVHVVEPTLENYAGHCYGLVRSLCDAAKDLQVTLWAGKHAAQLEFPANTEVRAHFYRRLRLLQLWRLLRRLLNSGDDPIVLTTAKRADLVIARLAARGTLPPARLYLYFHWFRESPEKRAFLRKTAAAQPNIGILATTESVAEVFRAAGFARVIRLPYPLTATPPAESDGRAGFRHLLFAGAARQDKGFKHIVELVELLRELGKSLPLTVQISAEHYGKYDEPTRAQLRRLENVGYAPLRLIRESLTPTDYADLFRGAVCLQPYDRAEFADRTSGVTMDALTQGAPVVATSGTWIARQIAPRDAGKVIDNTDARTLLAAAEAIIADYDRFLGSARAAGSELRARSWQPLFAQMR